VISNNVSPSKFDDELGAALARLDQPAALLTARETELVTRSTRVTLWRKVTRGEFPAPVEIASNRIMWRACEVKAWLDGLPRRTYGAPTHEAA
jgi:predicted DNA-binding transcriptional regulator AlpA